MIRDDSFNSLQASKGFLSAADNLCKQPGPRSGWTKLSGSNLFAILMVFLKDFFEKVSFEKKTADGEKITQHAKR